MIPPFQQHSQFSLFLLVLVVAFLSVKADSRRRQAKGQLQSGYSQEEFDDDEIRKSRDFEYFKNILSELFANEVPVNYGEDMAAEKNDLDFVSDPGEPKREWLLRPTNPRGDDDDEALRVVEKELELQGDLKYDDDAIENPLYDSSVSSGDYFKKMFRDKRKEWMKNKVGLADKEDQHMGEVGGGQGEKRREGGEEEEEEEEEGFGWGGGQSHAGHEHARRYLNEWLVHVPGGEHMAHMLARDLGYDFYGQVAGFEDVYRMVKSDHPVENHEPAHHLTRRFIRHTQVVWAEQQFAKERTKRMFHYPIGDYPEGDIARKAPDVALIRVKRVGEVGRMAGVEGQDSTIKNEEGWNQKNKKENTSNTEETKNATSTGSGVTTNPDDARTRRWIPNEPLVLNLLDHEFNDELWSHQWYLLDTRTRDSLPKLDLMVIPVWHQGLSGRGVRVLILDDGIEWTHDDLSSNYDASISYDMNDDDEDPMPSNHFGMINSHGTRCAGAVAMAANNGKCGVGVAFNARIGGIRMLDGTVTDRIEGSSLIHAKNLVDVVSCSWGPSDNGKGVEGPGTLAARALLKGVEEGRGGKGIIYVWASGNGGENDDCSCDGYASSVYTLSISSASESRLVPWYGESCPSTLATAYSSGAYTDQRIVSTDLGGSCTTDFTGTSAAAPLAAGIVALALEANGNATWRDVQHAVVWTSAAGPLLRNSGWTRNGRGLLVNPHFGFGLLNATGLVSALKDWVPVPSQRICRLEPNNSSEASLQSGQRVELHFDGNSCAGKEEVRFLEHVQVVATLNYTYRGALSLQLLSPQGTTTQLLQERLPDQSNHGFNSWPFMSVHTWGEDPRGKWTLSVNVKKTKLNGKKGRIGKVFLVLYGTSEAPAHMMDGNSWP